MRFLSSISESMGRFIGMRPNALLAIVVLVSVLALAGAGYALRLLVIRAKPREHKIHIILALVMVKCAINARNSHFEVQMVGPFRAGFGARLAFVVAWHPAAVRLGLEDEREQMMTKQSIEQRNTVANVRPPRLTT